MIGVFVFSQSHEFNGIADRIHLFTDEQSALDWQISVLIERGCISEALDGSYFILHDPVLCVYPGKVEVLEAFQDSCEPLEFFHSYVIQDRRAAVAR